MISCVSSSVASFPEPRMSPGNEADSGDSHASLFTGAMVMASNRQVERFSVLVGSGILPACSPSLTGMKELMHDPQL